MKYSVHPQAEDDLRDAASFYRVSGSGLVASRFLEEFERVARLLADNPGFGTPFDLPQRIHPLRVFPYSVVYKPTDEGVRVLAVRHQKRSPGDDQTRS